jgi:hypothetical protein
MPWLCLHEPGRRHAGLAWKVKKKNDKVHRFSVPYKKITYEKDIIKFMFLAFNVFIFNPYYRTGYEQ